MVFKLLVLPLFILHILFTHQLAAQTVAHDVVQSALKNPADAKTGLLVLQFGASGMTEEAARSFSTTIARNIANTNRFMVISPDEAENVVQKEAPELLPCFDIGCGIQIGRIMGATRVLAGHISLTAAGTFSLSVKLVNILDNNLEYEDSIRFNDSTMDRRFYTLSRRISNSIPLVGRILDANNKLAVISLGEQNGISVGDKLVIYKMKSLELEGPIGVNLRTQRQNIGILKITQVGEKTSEGVYFQSIETPNPNNFVTSYLDKRRQIEIIDGIRRELDTYERTVYDIEKPVVISPLQLIDKELKAWIRNIRALEEKRDFWQMMLSGSAAATGFFVYQFQKGDDWKVLGSLGALGFSAYHYFKTKKTLSEKVDEGRFKGYLELRLSPSGDEGSIGYEIRF